MLNYRTKNELKGSSHTRDISCLRIKQSDWSRELWCSNVTKTQNQVIELLEMTESVCCFYRLYTTVYPYVKIIIIAQSSLDVFRI